MELIVSTLLRKKNYAMNNYDNHVRIAIHDACLGNVIATNVCIQNDKYMVTIDDLTLLLTHWGWVTHICVSKLTIIGSDNGLSPGRRQAIIWNNAWILLIRTLDASFSEILSQIHIFSFKKIHLKMSSGKRRPFCLGLNVLIKPEYSIKIPHLMSSRF